MIHGFFSMLDEPLALEQARAAIEDVSADVRDHLHE